MSKDKKRPLTPKSTLIIRLIAGGYLVYLAYELFMGLGKNAGEGAPMAVAIAAAVIFAICGLVLVFFSGKDFLKGNFQGGIMDVGKTTEVEDKIEK